MQIDKLQIKNLRSIESIEVGFDKVTALLGSNNAGKSTILRALQLFFESAPKVEDDDFHKRAAPEIEVSITFRDPTPAEIEEFGNAVIDGRMTVSRKFLKDKGDLHLSYSVMAKSYPAFEAIRQETSKTKKRSDFNIIADATEGLDRATSAEDADAKMAAWELANPDKLELMSVGGFFGFPNVANGKLRKKTSVHFVPAVADASEQTSDPRRSPIIVLLAEIAKQIYENRQEVQDFVAQANTHFSELVSPARFPELANISGRLTDTIQKYYQDSKLLADWEVDQGIKVSFPQPVIRIEDNGFLSGLQNVGHGLQRAALFSVIEFLATSSAQPGAENFAEAQSDIILLVEEPEIYQHPIKQLVINDAFHVICQNFSAQTGIRFQIVFATHSEKFIGISKFHSARILRKYTEDDRNRHTASSVNLRECSEYFAALLNKEAMADDAFEAKMHIFSRELCEGFFADKVILVEGVTDKAILEGAYRAAGRDVRAEGISIIPVDGKNKLDKPFYIFGKLGIPTFAVFDSDARRNEGNRRIPCNHLLQKIANVDAPVDLPSGCFDRFAAFEGNIEVYLKGAAGGLWEQEFVALAAAFGLDVDDLCKTPVAIAAVCQRCREAGKDLGMFDAIIAAVDQLR
ncbi:ATP-dependent endonuclease [Cypionkella aquatica]|uniref:ATP-dependent endonuclease n=1 Tax=Cypionkella aquatica TaxID=1756042 RepID=A0AA37TST4_9RHOB|nr:AAA family ATPase [Cypionkella aquatica]GLS86818.1 ATP-dependent endonuclease [Cypionkella aquatica]